MIKRRLWGLGVVSAAALAFTSLAIAAAGDGSVNRISHLGRGAEMPVLGVDARGDQTLAWTEQRGNQSGQYFSVMTATRRTEGHWSVPVGISAWSEDPVEPVVAVEPSGAAVIAWIEVVRGTTGFVSVVEARTRANASSRWRRTARVASFPGSLSGLQLGIDNRGRVTAIWNTYRGARSILRCATGDAMSGRWHKARTLGRTGSGGVSPQLAVNSRGDVLVAWQEQVGRTIRPHAPSTLHLLETVRYRPAGGAWGPPVAVGRLSEPEYLPGGNIWAPTPPNVALDDQGGATVVWLSPRSTGLVLLVAHRRPGSLHWSRTRVPAVKSSGPVIGTDGAGALTIAFSGQHGMLMVTRSRDGVNWSRPAAVHGATSGYTPWLSVGQRGNAILTWFASHTRIFVSVRRRADGRWSLPTLIGHGVFPQAALDRAGIAALVWPRTRHRSAGWVTVLDAMTYPTR